MPFTAFYYCSLDRGLLVSNRLFIVQRIRTHGSDSAAAVSAKCSAVCEKTDLLKLTGAISGIGLTVGYVGF